MKDHSSLLKKIPIIKKIERIYPDEEFIAKLNPKQKEFVNESVQKIFAYRIEYISNKHKVVGFIVEPWKGKKLPCIVYNRGGTEDFGKITPWNIFLLFARLAEEGYCVIASQYSGVDGGEGKDEFGGADLNDVLVLYDILKKYKRADTKRIGMMGHSRGGLMTFLALCKANWVKAAVIASSTIDEVNAPKFRKGWAAHQKKMYGGTMKEKIKRSPIRWVNKLPKNVPILLMAGTADWRVDPMGTMKMAEKMYAHKIPYRLIMLEGNDHGLSEAFGEQRRQLFEWFDRFLKKQEKLPNLKPHGD